MPRAHLTLTVPDGVWIGDISRDHPEANVRILAAMADGETGVGLAEIDAPDPRPVVAAFEASDAVTELDLLHRSDDGTLVQFETTVPLLLLPVRESGIPLEMPFTLRDGRVEWEVTATRERLSELGDQLNAFGISFTVDWIRQRIEPEQLLTDTQLRVVRAAVEHGYYDTPRRTSLSELAAELDVAKSTCSETLHRAEGSIIKRFVADVDGNADFREGNT